MTKKRAAIIFAAAVLLIIFAIFFAGFNKSFSSGLDSLTVMWEGFEPKDESAEEIDADISGAAIVSKIYLVKSGGAEQIKFRFSSPGRSADGLRVFCDGKAVQGRVIAVKNRVYMLDCFDVAVTLKEPGEAGLTGDIEIKAYDQSGEVFGIFCEGVTS